VSIAVTGSGVPPVADTRTIGERVLGANRIVPSAPQLPPTPTSASHKVCTGPPAASTRFSIPPAKKASERPSGDQNGCRAPSVPASGSARSESSGRT
jgi:hypothetical protein